MSIETFRGGQVDTYREPAAAQPSNVVALMDWARSAQAAHEVATSLVQTSFVPQQFRGKPGEATAAILAGLELGFDPMASLRAFDIIQGTAAPRAMTLRAVVQSRGHEVWIEESTSTRAVAKGRRAGSDKVLTSVWDLDRARGLGLLGKENWKKQPGAMLVARVTSEICRLIASDAILGIPYAAEELLDGAPSEPATEPAAPRRRTARRTTSVRTAPATVAAVPDPEPADGPPLPGEDGYDDPPAADPTPDTEPTLTRPQSTKLHAIFTEAGISNRDTKLRAASLIVGRELDSSNDLTKAEATRLIDTLEDMASQGDLAEAIAELIGRDDETGDAA